jgi:hypothetical protein
MQLWEEFVRKIFIRLLLSFKAVPMPSAFKNVKVGMSYFLLCVWLLNVFAYSEGRNKLRFFKTAC